MWFPMVVASAEKLTIQVLFYRRSKYQKPDYGCNRLTCDRVTLMSKKRLLLGIVLVVLLVLLGRKVRAV